MDNVNQLILNQLILVPLRFRVIDPLRDLVQWDRYGIRQDQSAGFLYGWIKRDDGFLDFVLIQFQLIGTTLQFSYNTSSKKYSREIARRLSGSEDGYLECRSAQEIIPDQNMLIRWQRLQEEELNKA